MKGFPSPQELWHRWQLNTGLAEVEVRDRRLEYLSRLGSERSGNPLLYDYCPEYVCGKRPYYFQEAAIREAQIAVSCEDADSSYAALSKAFLAAGKSDKAEAAALSALKKNSRSVEAHLALAALRQARRQDEAALDEASAALKIDPYSVEALELKGTIFQQEGRPVECAMLWGRALELNRWDARLHLKMSWLLATELYEWQMALEHYNRYAELTSPRSQTPEPHDPREEQRDGMD